MTESTLVARVHELEDQRDYFKKCTEGLRQHTANLEFQLATMKKAQEMARAQPVSDGVDWKAVAAKRLENWETVKAEREDLTKQLQAVEQERDELEEQMESLKAEAEMGMNSLIDERDVLAKGLDEAVEKLKDSEFAASRSAARSSYWHSENTRHLHAIKVLKKELDALKDQRPEVSDEDEQGYPLVGREFEERFHTETAVRCIRREDRGWYTFNIGVSEVGISLRGLKSWRYPGETKWRTPKPARKAS